VPSHFEPEHDQKVLSEKVRVFVPVVTAIAVPQDPEHDVLPKQHLERAIIEFMAWQIAPPAVVAAHNKNVQSRT
jgi:hypothetical protein